jgi:S-methylmethionine-dependent homocysteine/selenocysteine methylase
MTQSLSEIFDRHLFLTAGGTETYLQFLQRYPLRNFCAFELLDDDAAFAALERAYLYPIVDVALERGRGLLADALLWRASRDYVTGLGYPAADVARFNRLGVARMRHSLEQRRAEHGGESCPILIAADLGPRGDGYQVPADAVEASAAKDYHGPQLEAVAQADVDLVCALTMTNVNEAVGIVQAARELGLPIVVSPTLETDGRLPGGLELGQFVERVDDATAGAPAFYMVNCAHPTHLAPVLEAARQRGDAWLGRFKGFRANASSKSHAELDNSTSLDRGDPADLGRSLAALQRAHGLRVVGGCCGTDAEHISAIGRALAGA